LPEDVTGKRITQALRIEEAEGTGCIVYEDKDWSGGSSMND
jgi:hypothetical protein